MPAIQRPNARRTALLGLLALLAATLSGVGPDPTPAGAAPQAPVRAAGPVADPFYTYTGSAPLSSIAPGTVLRTRTVPFHLAGYPLPIRTVQLLYRSTGSLGQPTVNVTSVVKPAFSLTRPKVVSYQSAYDSLNPRDQPSSLIAGGELGLGGIMFSAESLLLAPLLWRGHTVVIPDTEGQTANFGAGPEYGMNTLDSLRAVFSSSTVGLPSSTKAALLGYSGGAIATGWGAELAPSYAPDVNRRLVGSSIGGVLVHPARNLRYIEGTPLWSGVIPLALIGVFRAYDIDLTPYLSEWGLEIVRTKSDASIVDMAGRYPGLTMAQLLRPPYTSFEQIPAYVEVLNRLILGSAAPTTPLLVHQGAAGELEGTPGNKPGIGRGDGATIAGDVRTLVRGYCAAGTRVQYRQHELLSHVGAAVPWLAESLDWIDARFLGLPAPQNCSQVPPGNQLVPIPAP